MEIIVNYTTFKLEVNVFIAKGNKLFEIFPKTENELMDFSNEIKEWKNDCFKLWSDSFIGEEKTFFAKDILKSSSFKLGFTLPLEQKIRNEKNGLKEKINNLYYYLRLLDTSDAFINLDLVKKECRENFTVQQKKILLLKKLKDLNDGKYYDVNYIFWSNGISGNNIDEPRYITRSLEDNGYVKILGRARGLTACISIEGIEYLESIQEQKTAGEKNSSNSDMDNINQKLDEIIEWLKRNDMGNEIIFSELEEIKEAREKLDNKNWKQLIKGKLFDLGLDEAIGLGIKGASHIFKSLTGEEITKLLG